MLAQLTANIIISAALYAIAGTAFTLCFLVGRHLDFALGSAFLVGAYLPMALMEALPITPIPAVLGGMLFVAVLGGLLRSLIYRSLTNNGTRMWEVVIASLGIYLAMQAIASLWFGDEARILSVPSLRTVSDIGEARITAAQAAVMLIAVLVSIGTTVLLIWTRFGKAVRAISDDRRLSRIVGVAVERVTLGAVAVGYAIAAGAGALVALDIGITPRNGFQLMMNGVVAAVLAGVGRLGMLWMGALVLAVGQQLAAYFWSLQWAEGVTFALLILVLAVWPREIMGAGARKAKI